MNNMRHCSFLAQGEMELEYPVGPEGKPGEPENWDIHPGIRIEGDEELKRRIHKTLRESKYMPLFQKTVLPEPAKIPPMKLNVDDKAWRASRQNKMSARQVSPAKVEEMRRQVKLMEDLEGIQRSTQASHS
jgi:hypothetical protein